MLLKSTVFLFFLVGINAQHHHQWQQNDQNAFNQNIFDQNAFQNQDQATGNGAAAGNANVRGQGSVQSINSANHQANKQMTETNAMSANIAEGESPTVNGAAQASGTIQHQHQSQHNRGQQSFVENGPTFQQPGFGVQPAPVAGFFGADQSVFNGQHQKQGQATGNAAAAGNAGATGPGSASSINQANQRASNGQTAENSLSANTAEGMGANANGAAQAGGTVQNAEQGQFNFQQNRRHGSGF